jgi:threonine dehydratase
VAAAAKALGVRATVIMPIDAPLIKQRNTREYGAEVILYDRYTESREELARMTMEESGAILVPPYDDHEIMAGQGTVGLEFAHQLDEMEVVADYLICPAGGGGLIAGISTAFSKLSPVTKIFSAEPKNFDDTKRSLECGERVENEPGPTSICDSIVTQMPGILTFVVNKSLLSGGYAVTELEVKRAMLLLFEEFKIVTEPGGAVAFAAALYNRMEFAGKSIAIVISGGNIDCNRFCEIICEKE